MQYGPRISTDGLIFCLDAADSRSYPGSGTTWYDLTNTCNATLINGPSYSPNYYKGNFYFDGTNDYARATLPSTTTFSTFSYNVWVNRTTAIGWRTIIDQNNDQWFLGTWDGFLSIYNPIFTNLYYLVPGTWYNIAVTHEYGQPLYVYVNGELIYTSISDSTIHTTNYYGIGAGIISLTQANEFWKGYIGPVHVYNRALSSIEVQRHYAANKTRYFIY